MCLPRRVYACVFSPCIPPHLSRLCCLTAFWSQAVIKDKALLHALEKNLVCFDAVSRDSGMAALWIVVMDILWLTAEEAARKQGSSKDIIGP